MPWTSCGPKGTCPRAQSLSTFPPFAFDGELGDAAAEGLGLTAVDVADVAVGGGAVVGAGLAHVVGPGEADDEEAVREQQVD